MPLRQLTQGPRPDITPPQVVAVVTAGIPIVASLLSAFGLYDLSLEQQEALSDAVTWAGVLAASLIFGDAGLRTARNRRKAEVEKVLAEGGEDLEIVRSVVRQRAFPHAEPTTYAHPDTADDETRVMDTGFEEPPPPPVTRRTLRRKD